MIEICGYSIIRTKKKEGEMSKLPAHRYNAMDNMPKPTTLHIAVMYRLLNLCREHNLGISDLAKSSGVPVTTIKNILNGASMNTGINTLHKLCMGFGISLQDFFADELFAGLSETVE